MIVPIEVERAEAVASRIWQLVLEARDFSPSVSRALHRWTRAGRLVRRLWVTGIGHRLRRFQLASTRRRVEQRIVHDLVARFPLAAREMRCELAFARRAAGWLDRGRHGQTRRELAAALRAARPFGRIEVPDGPRAQPRPDTLGEWLALDAEAMEPQHGGWDAAPEFVQP